MYEPILKTYYRDTIVPALIKDRGYKNRHQVPAIEKVVINSGMNASIDKAGITDTVQDITNIAGQRPILTKARKSISNFKLRQGMPIGAKVTLRGAAMYDFLHRLIAIALPAIRDFRGVSNKLDGNGNYTIGIGDHTIFPEISVDNVKRVMGMDITIVTTTNDDDVARELLKHFGMPFRRSESAAPAEVASA
jgi:large subunit ribosomal protein L5